MKSVPKISVITPTLNQAVFIEKTIKSVLSQNYPNLEYLIIDGGSTDGTLEILKKYSGSLRWFSEVDKGQADAVNKGMRICTGDIIGYINSDDEYEPGSLQRVAEYFDDHPDTTWLTGKCKIIDLHSVEVMKLVTFYKYLLLRTRSKKLLKIVDFISQPATFWRKRIVDEIGFLNEEFHIVMDYDYWIRITERYPIIFMDEYLANFRTYPSSKTRQSAINQIDEEFLMIKKYSNSRLTLFFHYMHRLVNITIYNWFLR